jgi:hypothetical protein
VGFEVAKKLKSEFSGFTDDAGPVTAGAVARDLSLSQKTKKTSVLCACITKAGTVLFLF